MSHQPSLLANLAANVARTVRADPGERMRRMKVIAGTMAVAMLIGWATNVSAQTPSEPTPPPLPPLPQGPASQSDNAAPAPQQATAAPTSNTPTDNAGINFPPLPLGQGGVREAQSQLIALGFDPGAADGETGPATIAAAQQYNENRGGSGPVPIDGALLARLQQDTGPRLAPEQVAARAQPRYQPRAPSNPLAGAMQQFESNLRGLFNGGH
jgi:hypothetical protein